MNKWLSLIPIGAALLVCSSSRAGSPVLITDFNGGGAITAGTIFNAPSNSGTTDQNLAAEPNSVAIVDDPTGGAMKVLGTEFAFIDNSPTRWLRFNTFGGSTAVGKNPTIDLAGSVALRMYLEPNDPTTPDSLALSLGIRETNTTADIGLNGGTSGSIEFAGANGPKAVGELVPPQGTHVLTPGSWQDVVFNLPGEPVQAFTGNGVLASGKGVMESLGIWSPTGTTRPFKLYIASITAVPAQGAAIPEPGSMALLASGLVPLLALRRRKK